ncbi:integral membrane protein [Oesophagostomum dentatum]|uniref:Serpentine receptor class gamma n=1 Tax=Oesophagostomum dentatum TaxID=61180 RepID=A0A0B1SDN4_OESDE|nr:integral membrane protein [Oesophagostomum dentatum]
MKEVIVDDTTIAECENTTYRLVQELYYYIPLIYGIPTAFLYINIAAVIFAKRRNPLLKLAFFRIYAVYSIIMVVMWCFDMFTTRFLGLGYFCRYMLLNWGQPSYWFSPVQFVMTYSRHAQFYAATVVSINRMTAVLLSTSYNKIWETHWTKFLVVIFVLPIFTTWYLLPTLSYLAPYRLGGLTIAYVKLVPNPWNRENLLFQSSVTFTSLFVALLCAVIIFITTIITYSKVGAYRSNRSRSNKVDTSLLLVGMVSSVSTFLLAIAEIPLCMSINFGLVSRKHFLLAICIKQFVIDLTFVFSGWSTLVLCSAVRNSIFGMYSSLIESSFQARLLSTYTTTDRKISPKSVLVAERTEVRRNPTAPFQLLPDEG